MGLGSAGTVKPCFLEYKTCSSPFKPGPHPLWAVRAVLPSLEVQIPGPFCPLAPPNAPAASRSCAKRRLGLGFRSPKFHQSTFVKLTPQMASVKGEPVLQRRLGNHSPVRSPLQSSCILPNPCSAGCFSLSLFFFFLAGGRDAVEAYEREGSRGKEQAGGGWVPGAENHP